MVVDIYHYTAGNGCIILSPKGRMNIVRYIARTGSVEVYIDRSSPTLRGKAVLVYTKSDV